MSVTILERATATKPAVANWNLEYLGVGRLVNAHLLEAFALIKTRGAKVTYRETTKTLFTVTYHDLNISGPVNVIADFSDYLGQFNN